MDIGGIFLSEKSQREKDKYCMVSFVCGILKSETYRKRRVEWQLLGTDGGVNGEILVKGTNLQLEDE